MILHDEEAEANSVNQLAKEQNNVIATLLSTKTRINSNGQNLLNSSVLRHEVSLLMHSFL